MSASAPLAASGQASRHHDGRGAHSWRLRVRLVLAGHILCNSSLKRQVSAEEMNHFQPAKMPPSSLPKLKQLRPPAYLVSIGEKSSVYFLLELIARRAPG